MYNKEILKPPRVAMILGVGEQSVREHLKRGLWDFGEVIRGKDRGKVTIEYNIYRKKLERHIGRELTEEELA